MYLMQFLMNEGATFPSNQISIGFNAILILLLLYCMLLMFIQLFFSQHAFSIKCLLKQYHF